MLRLTDLLEDDGAILGQGGDVEVTGLASDSRKVRPGFLFAALAGSVTDGNRFVADRMLEALGVPVSDPKKR